MNDYTQIKTTYVCNTYKDIKMNDYKQIKTPYILQTKYTYRNKYTSMKHVQIY